MCAVAQILILFHRFVVSTSSLFTRTSFAFLFLKGDTGSDGEPGDFGPQGRDVSYEYDKWISRKKKIKKSSYARCL